MITHLVTFYRFDGAFSVLRLNERVTNVSSASINELGRQIHGSHFERAHIAAV